MITKIMIDAGMRRRKTCTGREVSDENESSPAYRIGQELSNRLERAGYETLFSGNVPELTEREESAGRPSVCASIAKRWGAECIVRLCTRASELPSEGGAQALVYRRNSGAWSLGESVLQSLERESGLRSNGVRSAAGMLLLRRSVCPSMILVLQLPFRQMEMLTIEDAGSYADSISAGIDLWAKSMGSAQSGTSGSRYKQA